MFKSQMKLKFGKSFFIGFSLIVSCFLLRMDSNCMIYSRIQGEILNNDSGSPIADAEVRLINYDSENKWFSLSIKIKTDKSGKFVFDDIIPGFYLVNAEKDGFISAIPEYKIDAIKGVDLQNLRKALAVITIDKEGSIKHLKILLKPGCTIKGQITGIIKKDVLGKPLIRVILSRKTDEAEKLLNFEDEIEIKNSYVNANGSYSFKGLEPRNDYKLLFKPEGFPRRYFNDIDILSKDTAIIDCIYDNNNKTGIKGQVRLTGKVPDYFFISLNHNLGGDKISYYNYDYQNNSLVNPNGEFSIFMVLPGQYYVHAITFDENGKSFVKDSFIEVKKDETSVINFDFRSEL